MNKQPPLVSRTLTLVICLTTLCLCESPVVSILEMRKPGQVLILSQIRTHIWRQVRLVLFLARHHGALVSGCNNAQFLLFKKNNSFTRKVISRNLALCL